MTELMVVSVILGLLGLGLSQLMNLFGRGLRHVEKRLPPQNTLHQAFALIQRDFASGSRSSFMNLLPDPGFEQSPFFVGASIYPVSLRAVAGHVAGCWAYAPVRMNPINPALNAQARINSSTLAGVGCSWLMASVGSAAGSLPVQTANYTLSTAPHIVGGAIRVDAPGGACTASIQVWTNAPALVWSTSTVSPTWQVLVGSFTTAGPMYNVKLVTANSGPNTCRAYYDDVYLSPVSLTIGGPNPAGLLQFVRYDAQGDREQVTYTIQSAGGNTRLRRQVQRTDGTQETTYVTGLVRLDVGWEGGAAVWPDVDRPLVVNLQACGVGGACADPMSLNFEVYPVGR